MTILQRQRQAFTNKLGPASERLAHPDLMFAYLASLGYTQPTLLDRLHAWGTANNIPQLQRLTRVGLVSEAPPGPTGPLDIDPGTGPVEGLVIPITTTQPVLHVRLTGMNSAGGTPNFSMLLDATPMTHIVTDSSSAAGDMVATAFYITGLVNGAHNVTINVTGASITNAFVRLGELVSQSGIGGTGTNVSDNPAYYTEVYATRAGGSSQFGSAIAFNNAGAHNIYGSNSDTEQWAAAKSGHAARFATGTSAGEGNSGMWVHYTRDGNSYKNAGIVYEILDAVLP